MTVKELIAKLEEYDNGTEVYFLHPSHDYWRTVLASEVDEVDVDIVHYDQYHQQYILGREETPEEEETFKNVKTVLVLKG